MWLNRMMPPSRFQQAPLPGEVRNLPYRPVKSVSAPAYGRDIALFGCRFPQSLAKHKDGLTQVRLFDKAFGPDAIH